MCVFRTHIKCDYEGHLKDISAACHTLHGVQTVYTSLSVDRRTVQSSSFGTPRLAHTHTCQFVCHSYFVFCVLFGYLLVVSTSAVDCLERLVPEMMYYMSSMSIHYSLLTHFLGRFVSLVSKPIPFSSS